jgi:hypothetical protein
MIIQLPCGKIIECSVEIYLALTDAEYKELNGLGVQYTSEDSYNPFYKSSIESKDAQEIFLKDYYDEHEPDLYEIDDEIKRIDEDFHSDDIE